jgi:CSLREA domain-containing protein
MASVLVRSIAAAAIGLLLFAASASATPAIVVTSNADPGNGSACTLRDAITAANTDATVGACTAGAGSSSISVTATGTIQLASALPTITTDMTITGPGAGSLDVHGQVGTADYPIFDIETGSGFPNVTLEKMTISHGSRGVFDNTGGSLTLNNATVSGNSATGTSATQSIVSGAGIASNFGASLSINSSTVSGNTATATVTGPGGLPGVFALASGGAISQSNGSLSIDQSTISGNATTAHGDQEAFAQGMVNNDGGNTLITRSTISGNTVTATASEVDGAGDARAFGGAIDQTGGGSTTLSIDGVTIAGNTAAATASQGGSVTASGGGIYAADFGASLATSVTGSTIAGNTVSASGSGSPLGANADLNGTSSSFSFTNTIIANPVGAANCTQESTAAFTSLGYNIDTGSTSTCLGATTTGDQTNTNPALGPLQNNGGLTQTMAPGIGSPAVDKGTAAGDSTDQRGSGFIRTFDMNPANADDGTDVGAVEQSVKATPMLNDFGSLRWGTTSGTQLFLMNNYTGNDLPAGTVLGGANAGDFQTSTDGCTNTGVPNNTFCTLDVAFHPVSTGNGVKNAILSFSVSPVELATLTGTATEYVSVAPTSHNFGSTQTGTPTGATDFVVTNAGPGTSGTFATTLAGPNASEFGITANTCAGHTLAALATCTVSVRFAPATAGAKNATLKIIGTPGGTTSASLTGTATAAPAPPAAGPTGQRSAALKKCKKKKDKQKRKKCKKKANRLPV